MRKIIAAYDGLKYHQSTIHHSIDIAKKCNVHLVGVSLEDFTYHNYTFRDIAYSDKEIDKTVKEFNEKDTAIRKNIALQFEDECRQARIHYSIHHDKNIALQDLLHESIYADLLVICSGETLTHYNETTPSRFIQDLLANVQCPVLLVPVKYKAVEKIVFLYDGEPSSVYSVKMFSYMLSCLSHLPVEVVTVKKARDSLHLPDNRLMKEFMKQHYPAATYTVLKGEAESEIISYLRLAKENVMIVTGAYRRGMVSRWFKESMADVIMKNVKFPLFVAHTK